MIKNSNYRPELDVLRGVSILGALLYHLEVTCADYYLFSSGYLAVDIFFVISSYLITKTLLKGDGRLSRPKILDFFERRIRRILPLLLLVLTTCLVVFLSILMPSQLIDFCQATIASLFMGSNIYWWYTLQNYAAESSSLKPLLHIWTLGIEEQFYVFLPFLLLAIGRFKKTVVLGTLVFLISTSLVANAWITPEHPEATFYLLPFRLWELLAGTLGYFAQPRLLRYMNLGARKILVLVTGLAIFYLLFVMRSSGTSDIGTRFITVVCTVLFILFAEGLWSGLVKKIFWPVQKMGVISYSLYLWHLPIFVFARLSGKFHAIPWKILLFLAVFPISYLSYRYVEEKFRYRSRAATKPLLIGIVLLMSALLGGCLLVIERGGFPRGNGSLSEQISTMRLDRRRYWNASDAMRYVDFARKSDLFIAVIGNSWALDIASGLDDTYNGVQVYFEGMTGPHCRSITLPANPPGPKAYRCLRNRSRFEKNYSKFDLLIIADNRKFINQADKKALDEMKSNLQKIRDRGYAGPVLFVGNRPTWSKSPMEIEESYDGPANEFNRYAQTFLSHSLTELKNMDAFAERTYEGGNSFYFSLVDTLCPKQICTIKSGGKFLYWDWEHLSPAGGEFVRSELLKKITSILEGDGKGNKQGL